MRKKSLLKSSSQYLGVGYCKNRVGFPWRARTHYKGKEVHLGRFATEADAARKINEFFKNNNILDCNGTLFQNNIIFVVLLWGGFTTNFIWCMFLNFKNKSFGDYLNKNSPLNNNYIFAALAGTTWFLQFFFYGMGESKLGNGASSWILHMAMIILVSSMWGLILKEWKGVSKKTFVTILTGIAVIILSVIIVGYGNSLNE